ncbi:hypothetical protein [Legionella spiritensis]|uniref:Proteolipid membrane potential modulator n=1 Tax=Legionella spiritensis TaxID=452 RepID=A0A0W0YZA8_LEGSP|nr:hypothetical protein [Legionella spiritensis]KTD62224.1 hypothetical protein Lspi_2074 [Legionella spiritensis]SNV29115.1 Uncharacterised protein [Legionella spiritensis]VEG91744.1 Uncharacterised protein [Legionella spiritensis]
MKQLFMFLFAAAFPWLVFLMKDNPGAALVALIMQASIIGWIPASTWAWRTLRDAQKKPGSQHSGP